MKTDGLIKPGQTLFICLHLVDNPIIVNNCNGNLLQY